MVQRPIERRFVTTETIISGMAGRYASALFALAKEQGVTDTVAKQLNDFDWMIAGNDDLAQLVRSPVLTSEDQTRALNAIFEKASINGIAANFIRLVTAKRRLFAVRSMIAGYNKLLDTHNGVVRADVTVAQPLNDIHMASLQEALKTVSGGASVDVNVKVDSSIIGGLVVKLGSRMVDASLKTKLNSIRSLMKEVG